MNLASPESAAGFVGSGCRTKPAPHAQPGGRRIAQPVGRRQPDERQDRDHPEVVGQCRPLVAPEERARERGGQRIRAGRNRLAVERQIGVVDAVGDGDDRQDQDDPQHGGHPVGERADHEQDDALGPLHEADLALSISDSARARA